MSKQKIVVLTGAGISKESGIDTFRDKGGLWENHSIEEVAHIKGWQKDPRKVLEFYNKRRLELKDIEPNDAHVYLKKLEEKYNVSIVTQNVDDLHEKAGSSNIVHLHGKLTHVKISDKDDETSYNIGYQTIEIGMTPENFGYDINESLNNQLRPDVVWFGENVPELINGINEIQEADIVIIIGTSLNVYPAASLLEYRDPTCDLYVIDPSIDVFNLPKKAIYFQYTATKGMKLLYDKLIS